jgi:hypothetical protein
VVPILLGVSLVKRSLLRKSAQINLLRGCATLTAAGQSGSKVVLKSGQYKVGFNATKAGVYTIKYSAVDYFGNTVTKEFFVKVVD